VNDSWGVYIRGDQASFFDNDANSDGVRSQIYEDQGGSTIYEFVSTNPNDPWTMKMNQPIADSRYSIYLELFLGEFNEEKRPSIFKCHGI
jgi:hypothetical protein